MMGYSNGYVASILVKNKPLREFKYNGKRTVKVPFGSEYILRLKNKSKAPALVEVSIDGADVLNGSELVLSAGETLDLERFVDDSSKGKKFKYISLEEGSSTGEIDDPYREENGLVRVKFYEAMHLPPLSSIPIEPTYHPFCGCVVNPDFGLEKGIRGPRGPEGPTCANLNNTRLESYTTYSSNLTSSAGEVNSCFFSQESREDLSKDKGATVEGSNSNQSFTTTTEYVKLLRKPTIVDIFMVGPNYKEEEKIVEWGVFIGSTGDPIATFKEPKHAHLFAANADFGKFSVTVKPL